MKKLLIAVILFGLFLSGCMPAFGQQPTTTPTAASEADLQGTAAVLSQQTLQALPTPTVLPSETPVIITPTQTEIANTPTETQNPSLLTLTATLGTGTVTLQSTTGPPGTGTAASTVLPNTNTPGGTFNSPTSTLEPKPQFYGTLPPDLPSGIINLYNKSHVDAYISLRCETNDGYVTILEYPVNKQVRTAAPAGSYTYVAWVGGRQFTGEFSLGKDAELNITLFKEKITVNKKK